MFRQPILAAMLLPLPAFAGEITVAEAWVPAAPPTARTHAAYLTVHNGGETPRVLVGVSAEGYGMSHMHESKQTDGVATMSMLHNIEIPADGFLTMRPGGLHVMLMAPPQPVAEGDTIALKLSFANGETLAVNAVVKNRALAN